MEPTIDGGNLYWLELHPSEGGRYALYARRSGRRAEEAVPRRFNVRTRVHEYGGAPYIAREGTVFFSNFRDQVVYRLEPGSDPVPITKEGLRYADCVVDASRGRLIGVCEDHTGGGLPKNTLSAFAVDGSSSSTLASGNDFYSSPRIDSTGSKLAWVTWNFPNMPWDGTELWTADLTAKGGVANRELVAGGKDESVIHPQWSPDGSLYFLSDRSGYWSLSRSRDGKVEDACSIKADIGRPTWAFRANTYAIESPGRVVFTFTKGGVHRLAVLDTESGEVRPVAVPYTYMNYVSARKGYAYMQAGSPTEPPAIVKVRLADGRATVVHRPRSRRFAPSYISTPRHIAFKTTGGKKAYAFFYAPKSRDYAGPRGERPPLVVVSHGGPTSAALTYLNLGIQAWTSRGFAVLDVNYGGSSGYGREYRERLAGNWGIVDVDDCVSGALSLSRRGLVDGRRMVIRGASAGGYTTLCALAFRKVFSAGASHYGVSDAEALARDTHKFESRYMDKLIAPYPARRQVYAKRSAINYPDRISVPMIFFQGLEDKVVDPSQAARMVDSLRRRGIPVAYVPFKGEQHGFRRAGSIKRAFEAELYFYSRVFGFRLPERTRPVRIWNLPPGGPAKRA
jgi:dipeptidyl aminopeptidase/acylaminoacyl peptidase